MNKPKAPKKPLKNQTKPSRFKYYCVMLFRSLKGKPIKLVEVEDLTHQSYYDFCQEGGFVAVDINSLEFSTLEKAQKLLDIEDFKIEIDQHENILIIFKRDLPDDEYQKILDDWENRFRIYEKQYQKYQKELKKYKKYKGEERKKELRKELNKLEN